MNSSNINSMKEAKRSFNINDQIAFAEISGDYNPLHLDKIVARRSMFGDVIVHGMHLVLWALNVQESSKNYKSISKIKVNFFNGVFLENEITYRWQNNNEKTLGNIFINKKKILKIEITWSSLSNKNNFPLDSCPPKELSNDLDLKNHKKGWEYLNLFFPMEKVKRLFPNILEKTNPLQISTLLSTTRLIGNKCPGLNSIFTKLDIDFKKKNQISNFQYQLSSFDDRFGLANIIFKSPNSEGSLNAFERPKPIIQKSYKFVKNNIKSSEFKGIRSLIVGGSRGLGELATKILCAGGSIVTSTYFSGVKEAEEIKEEIISQGGEINFKFFDTRADNTFYDFGEYDLLIYMATPFISSSKKGEFDQKIFKNFCDYYIFGFSNLCNFLSQRSKLRVLYPSSIYINQIPLNMGEYSAAKAAGEILCLFLEKSNPNLKIHIPRFNKLETDQTSSILPQNLEDSMHILLKAIRDTLK